jgi:hypothetical protein
VDVLSRLPADLDLDGLARETKALARGRVLRGGALLLRLALARGPGGLSLSQTAAWASVLGLSEMSDPAIKYRLDKAVGFLNALLERQLAGDTTRWPGRIPRVADGSSISKPGSKGTDWRVHGVYDLGRGEFLHLDLTDSHGAEGLCRGAPVPGEVRIADRDYARLRDLRELLRQGNGLADFIVRPRWRSLTLYSPDGVRFDPFEYLRGLPVDQTPHEIVVHARDTGRAEACLPASRAADRFAQVAGSDGGGTQTAAPGGLAQTKQTRSAWSGSRRVRDASHFALRHVRGRGHHRRVSPALAGRTRHQTNEVADPCR